ncbi:cysteine desulfurase family protein [Tindallia californiensis]|uniref:cysteine desulfurase n=1 Tax=Tindallia californiensis TaxID=159292 RepID=A0A1H3N9V4_9FIRM|nr:cysteine desulfurase family protein [Tindallia californiensis]SDY85513.1 cysteine desulfurase [Tindallia californiensis]
MQIYLDHAATSPITSDVLEEMNKAYMSLYANPSSAHSFGSRVEKRCKEAKKKISKYLSGNMDQMIITSGGTESNNHAIFSQGIKAFQKPDSFLTSSIEHKSVLEPMKFWSLSKELSVLNVEKSGQYSLDHLENLLKKGKNHVAFISLMHVNNETGIIQPIEEAVKLIQEYAPDAFIHVDGVQAFGKISIKNILSWVDAYSISAHKIKGPRGIGALWVKKPDKLLPLIRGGGQENNNRSGTTNTPALLGFEKAVSNCHQNMEKNNRKKHEIREKIIKELSKKVDDFHIIESATSQVPSIIMIAFKKMKGEVLIHSLEADGIFLSAGSACNSSNSKISHVIKAMNVPSEWEDGIIRVSFDEMLEDQEIVYFTDKIAKHCKQIRRWVKR